MNSTSPLQMSVRDAINSAMDEEMARDKHVFILGEEVTRHMPYHPCVDPFTS